MSKFTVYRYVDVTYRFHVEAENEAEVLAKADDLYAEQGDYAEWERQTTDEFAVADKEPTP